MNVIYDKFPFEEYTSPFVKLPVYYDLREFMQPVRDQRDSTAGAAFAAAAVMEYHARRLNDDCIYIDPFYTYNLRSTKTTGMRMDELLQSMKINGMKLAYNDSDPRDWRIRSYAIARSIDAVKAAIVAYGPCLICLNVYDFSTHFWRGEGPHGTQCLTIVGYDKEGFILRNSWGQFGEILVIPYFHLMIGLTSIMHMRLWIRMSIRRHLNRALLVNLFVCCINMKFEFSLYAFKPFNFCNLDFIILKLLIYFCIICNIFF